VSGAVLGQGQLVCLLSKTSTHTWDLAHQPCLLQEEKKHCRCKWMHAYLQRGTFLTLYRRGLTYLRTTCHKQCT
jgi:hypothetical protein